MASSSKAEIDLLGANVAITGAARGIGLATARAFAEVGAVVWIGDLDGEEAAADAKRLGGKGFALDVRSRDSFAEFLDRVEGRLDVLVNNAGIMPAGPFLDEPIALADATIDINLRGPLIGMKLALPGMVARGRGHVVNVASGLGRFEVPGLASYCASKHGAVGLSGTVAREIDGTGVTVTAVLPSAVHTELSSGVAFPFERVAKVTPEQVAAAIIDSCATRPREVMVPRWMGPLPPVSALLPGPLERLMRGALSVDDRALELDAERRRSYTERVARQTSASRS
jgi:NAD(P)-dependent dehydrogenase (short-subunit alcohol dehydrogenase family)